MENIKYKRSLTEGNALLSIRLCTHRGSASTLALMLGRTTVMLVTKLTLKLDVNRPLRR